MVMQTTSTFDRLVLNWKPRFKILQGGTASSKTYSILQYLVVKARRSKEQRLVSIVAETLPSLRKGAIRDFIRILGDSYDERLHNQSQGLYHLGLWTFEFFGADIWRRMKGARRDYLFINECNNVRYEVYSQLEMRTGIEVYLDFNPSSEFWVHEKLIPSLEESEYYYDISTYKDNQYSPPNVVSSIERRKFNADGTVSEYYKVYGQGKVGSLEGVIFDNWEIGNFPADDGNATYGIDFGFSVDPAALVKVLIKNDTVYVKEIAYGLEKTNADLAEILKERKVSETDEIYADSAEPKSIVEIRKKGFLVRPAIKGADSVRTGIDWLKAHKIIVSEGSVNLLKELRNYVWMTDITGKQVGKPVDNWNHCLDALRYACSGKIVRRKVILMRMAM